ncbi:MAG: hypothetical protein AAF321_11340, partial [Pseudomonadota bacterium]
MKTRTLKTRSGATLDLTELGFGGAPLGNMLKALPEEQAQETLYSSSSVRARHRRLGRRRRARPGAP